MIKNKNFWLHNENFLFAQVKLDKFIDLFAFSAIRHTILEHI
jgi:hypothetical protein